MNEALATWIVAIMASWIPPAAGDVDRYNDIARDLVTAATERPLFAEDEGGVPHTLVYLAAVASFESFYRADVDEFRRRGDGGAAYGLFQVHLLRGERCDTRLDCVRIGRERIRLSWAMCRHLARPERLAQFMTGRCQTNPDARWRYYRAERTWKGARADATLP